VYVPGLAVVTRDDKVEGPLAVVADAVGDSSEHDPAVVKHREVVAGDAEVGECVQGLPGLTAVGGAQTADHTAGHAGWVFGLSLRCAADQRALGRAYDRHHAVITAVAKWRRRAGLGMIHKGSIVKRANPIVLGQLQDRMAQASVRA